MEAVYKVAAVCLTAAVLSAVLKKNSPHMTLLLMLAVAVVAFCWLKDILEEVTAFLRQMALYTGLAPEVFVPLLKTAGIALLSRMGASLCRDAEEETLAVLVEIAAAFGAIWVSLPLLKAVWEMLQRLL